MNEMNCGSVECKHDNKTIEDCLACFENISSNTDLHGNVLNNNNTTCHVFYIIKYFSEKLKDLEDRVEKLEK